MRISASLLDVISGTREDDPDELDRLTESIRRHGLLHPLVVTPNPKQEGRYVVLAGRRRLICWRRINRRKIKCIIKTYNEFSNEMLELTENFDRLELTTPQRDAAIIRYAELLRLREAARIVELDAREQAALRENGSISNGALTLEGDLRRHKTREPEIIDGIVKATGVTRRVAQKILRRADIFSDEERDVLIRSGISDKRLDRIAAVTDAEKRHEIIDLINDGASYPDAMFHTLGEEFVYDEGDLSDEDFLDSLPLSRGPVNQHRFRTDALLYRQVQARRIAFTHELQWTKIKGEVKSGGIYYRRMIYFLDAPHPRDWLLCSGCTAGIIRGQECGSCKGGGYLITS